MEIVLQTLTQEALQAFKQLTYFTVLHGKNSYHLHFFCCVFDDMEALLQQYEKINDVIAYDFQSVLDKNIEKWNVYLFCLVKTTLPVQVKKMVEQNKYGTRKFVVENVQAAETIAVQKQMIQEKMLTLHLSNSQQSQIQTGAAPILEAPLQDLLNELRTTLTKRKKTEKIKAYLNEVKQ